MRMNIGTSRKLVELALNNMAAACRNRDDDESQYAVLTFTHRLAASEGVSTGRPLSSPRS